MKCDSKNRLNASARQSRCRAWHSKLYCDWGSDLQIMFGLGDKGSAVRVPNEANTRYATSADTVNVERRVKGNDIGTVRSLPRAPRRASPV